LATDGGVLLDLSPDDPLGDLVARVRAAVARVLGDQHLAPAGGLPHITLGYATGDTDSGPVCSGLRRVRPRRAGITVDRVHLVDVVQDPGRHECRWTSVAEIPLAVPAARGRATRMKPAPGPDRAGTRTTAGQTSSGSAIFSQARTVM
jgi:hypothetical protein